MWGCISCDGIGPITKVEGRLNGSNSMGAVQGSEANGGCGHKVQTKIQILECFQTFSRY